MVVIKFYSQDMYVASVVSRRYAGEIAKILNIEKDDLFFIGGEGSLVTRGVPQTGWFTYLEISLPASKIQFRTKLESFLQKVLSDYGVHLMIKYDFFEEENVTKLINEEFDLFNEKLDDFSHESLSHDHGEDEDDERNDFNEFMFDSYFDEDYDDEEDDDDSEE